jgi:hypothetical protein
MERRLVLLSKFNSDLFHGTKGSPQMDIFQELNMSHTRHQLSNKSYEEMQGNKFKSRREQLLNIVETNEAKQIINELYRSGAKIGDGGTADAIRHERRTGENVGGKGHIIKGIERLRQIEKILERNQQHPDKAILEYLKQDLSDALEGLL